MAANGSGRRRPRGVRVCEGNRGSASIRAPVVMLRSALAAAISRVWVRRRFMYSLTCWSVTCLPGTGGLFWRVENLGCSDIVTESQADPPMGTAPAPGSAYGWATSNLPLNPAPTINPDCRWQPPSCRRTRARRHIRQGHQHQFGVVLILVQPPPARWTAQILGLFHVWLSVTRHTASCPLRTP